MKINLYNYHNKALEKAESMLFDYYNDDWSEIEYRDIVEVIINESEKEDITREEAIMVVEELEAKLDYI